MTAQVGTASAITAPRARPRRCSRFTPPFELVESKLCVPRRRKGAVQRDELICELEEASAAVPAVFVSAGPGWGKTTLLSQWSSRSPRPFAWVSLDEDDNDPLVLLTYVVAALDRATPLDAKVLDVVTSPGASVEGEVVPRLGAALADADQPFVLVLDDVHMLDSPQSVDAIAALTSHVPEGSQLALSARGETVFPVGALRAQGLAMEIGPDELRMNDGDARQLLRAAGLDLADAEVAELTDHTEGWSAGLHLAAVSAKASGAGAKATGFRGDDQFLVDYLHSELLSQLPPDELRFLTRTAILERMAGPLCDAVVDWTASTTALAALESSNLFVVALDRNQHWYRYHRLFQELLRAELERREPELVPQLLTRASEWCEANEQPESAIRYAQAAGDVDRVARLLVRCALPVYYSGRAATVEGWLAWLAEKWVDDEPDAAVAVIGGMVAGIWGRPEEADRWSEAAERGTHDGALPDGSASIDSWRALQRAQRCHRGVDRMRADAEHAVATVARGSQFRPTALFVLAMAHWLAGELDRADDLFADAVEAGVELGAAASAAAALGERALIASERGAWVAAGELIDQALPLMRRSRSEEYPSSALTYAVAARVALHLGDAHGAQELLTRAQQLRPRLTFALPYYAVQTRLELARAYLTLADASGATAMLREIDAILRHRPGLGILADQADALRASLTTLHTHAPGASTLTDAELRLLPYLATHLSFREIGERLYLSRHTVKSHAMAIYRKLSVASRNAAVDRARELSLF